MTREQAIGELEYILIGHPKTSARGQAVLMAIEALKQPEKKKAKWIVRHRHEHYPSGSPYDEDVCPFCKRADHNGDGLYCGYCGAKVEIR